MVGAIDPIGSTCDISPMASMAAPRANTAEISGMAIESSEPNAIMSTIAAATSPISSLPDVGLPLSF
jgi:hypothetical protein